MAITQRPPVNQATKGTLQVGAHLLVGNVWFLQAAAAPTAGTSGDGAGFAGPGSLYVDTSGAKLYINTGTASVPAWTVVGAQTA